MMRAPVRIDLVEIWVAAFLVLVAAGCAVIWIFSGDPMPLVRLVIIAAPLLFVLHLVMGWTRDRTIPATARDNED